jgi:hypothetical protein
LNLFFEIYLEFGIYFLEFKKSLFFDLLKKKGEILKRPTRADCKSADYIFAGSNPALPTKES